MEIRKFTDRDAVSVSALIKECFDTLDLGGHTEEGKRIQIGANSPQNLLGRAQHVRYFIAVNEGEVVGICGFDQNKVQTLFVDIRYQHMGIGKALLHKVLTEAMNEGLTSLKTWATFYSERFYSKAGFKKVGEIHLPEGRNDIILIEMQCDLSR
jgi:predicted N-acetyltransferase YhbS